MGTCKYTPNQNRDVYDVTIDVWGRVKVQPSTQQENSLVNDVCKRVFSNWESPMSGHEDFAASDDVHFITIGHMKSRCAQ
jgi:hypothetical protein